MSEVEYGVFNPGPDAFRTGSSLVSEAARDGQRFLETISGAVDDERVCGAARPPAP
jgi:hypothetical protein